MCGVLAIQTRWHRHSCEVFWRSVNLNHAVSCYLGSESRNHFAMVAKLWGCDGPCCMLCVPVFSSISSPGRMDLPNEVLVAFRQSDHSSASAPRRCNPCAKLQPLGRKYLRWGVLGRRWRCRAGELLWQCWGRLRMSVVIAAPWIRFWGVERQLWSFRDLCFWHVWCLCHSQQMV